MDGGFQKITIDVVIPAYNAGPFISAALESVVRQDFLPRRIIVVDDGSTDETAALVQAFADRTAVPVELIRQDNAGLSAARNAGWRAATAEWVAFLDSDDRWLPAKLAEQARVIRDSEVANLALVYGGYELIDESGRVWPGRVARPELRGPVFSALLPANRISGSGSCVLVSRRALADVGGFDPALTALEDWDLWLRLAQDYGFDFTPATVVQIRRHRHNMQADADRMLDNLRRFVSKWCAVLPAAEVPRRWARELARWSWRRYPAPDFFTRVGQALTATERQRLLRSTFGHWPLYLLLTAPRLVFERLAVWAKRFIRRRK